MLWFTKALFLLCIISVSIIYVCRCQDSQEGEHANPSFEVGMLSEEEFSIDNTVWPEPSDTPDLQASDHSDITESGSKMPILNKFTDGSMEKHEVLHTTKGVRRFPKSSGDFVKSVSCHGSGMDIELQSDLPKPVSGMWDLEVEGFPNCTNVARKDVGGGHRFTILYSHQNVCGVEPLSHFSPPWVSYAEVTLLLKDENNTTIADSVSCLYQTRVDASLVTFQGQVTNEQIRYAGSVDDEGTDVEGSFDTSQAIYMEFVDELNRALGNKNVRLGEPIKLIIEVSDKTRVNQILPETCYFSSSSSPGEYPEFGHTLVFVKRSCFNDKNPIVRAILPKMDRSSDGSRFELNFPAFHFAKYGRNLYVHCSIVTCVGNEEQCIPDPECFGSNRRKRNVKRRDAKSRGPVAQEVQLSRGFVVQNDDDAVHMDGIRAPITTIREGNSVCLDQGLLITISGATSAIVVLLLAIIAWMVRRRDDGKEKILSEFAKENIGKQYAVLMNGYQKGDWHVTSTIYGPNCTILAPGRPAIKGKEGAENYWKALKDELNITKIEIKCDELNGAGNWFFERGVYKLFSGDTSVQDRIYVKIWRKYEGKMLIHSYIYNVLPVS